MANLKCLLYVQNLASGTALLNLVEGHGPFPKRFQIGWVYQNGVFPTLNRVIAMILEHL